MKKKKTFGPGADSQWAKLKKDQYFRGQFYRDGEMVSVTDEQKSLMKARDLIY